EIIRAFQAHYPDEPVTVTTMTVTGSKRVRTLFGDQVFHVYVPYDTPFFVKQFLRRVEPKMAVFMETELWPNLLRCTHQANIPLMLANARLSERSVRRYRKILLLTRSMLQCFA